MLAAIKMLKSLNPEIVVPGHGSFGTTKIFDDSERYYGLLLERGLGPKPGEYQGLPINDADRMRADSWTASLWTVPEHQCIPHPADYGPASRVSVSGKTWIR